MTQAEASRVIKQADQLDKLLLEGCDSDIKALLRLTEVSLLSCGSPAKPTLTIACKSREVAEAIGLRQASLRAILKRMLGCKVVIDLYYHIPEGLVHFDIEGEVAPARWYLCNRRELGKVKIPLDI